MSPPNVADGDGVLNRQLLKDKLWAFLVHGLFSVAIAIVAVAVVYGLWNAPPLHIATGITRIFLLMLVIDVILGPLLTFLVYKKGKKTLKFDLAVIFCLQMSALAYGVYHVHQGRAVWIVYNVDRFDLVRANEIDERKLDQADPIYQQKSHTGAKYVASVIPMDDIEQKNAILFDELAGIAPSQRPELYQPIDIARPDIKKRALDLSQLAQYNDKSAVSAVLSKYPNANAYLPLKANAVDMAVLVDNTNGDVIKIVDLRPW